MERTNFGSNKILFLPHASIFSALVSSRAVRISSRAVRVFPALSLRGVRPSYGTFSLMVLQGNCARGRTGHMIRKLIRTNGEEATAPDTIINKIHSFYSEL